MEESRRAAMGGTSFPQTAKSMNCAADGCERPTNVGTIERAASVAFGVAATLVGIERGGTAGLLLAGIGAAALYRGISGRCYAYEALGIDTSESAGESVSAFAERRKIERKLPDNGRTTSASTMPGTS